MYSITQEDLIQYVYNETSIERTAAIKMALDTDWGLREKYEEIMSTLKTLEKVNLSPRKKTVDAILAYAEKSVTHLITEA